MILFIFPNDIFELRQLTDVSSLTDNFSINFSPGRSPLLDFQLDLREVKHMAPHVLASAMAAAGAGKACWMVLGNFSVDAVCSAGSNCSVILSIILHNHKV